MTTAPLTPAPPVPTPVPTAVLLERVVDAKARRDAAEVELAELALAWAHAHVTVPASESTWGYDPDAPYGIGDTRAHPESVEWYALPWRTGTPPRRSPPPRASPPQRARRCCGTC